MASVNYNKPITRAAYVSSNNPLVSNYGQDTVYVGEYGYYPDPIYEKRAYFFAEGLPSSEGKILTDFVMHYTAHNVVINITYPTFWLDVLTANWTEAGLTYYNPPSGLSYNKHYNIIGSSVALTDLPKQDYEKIRAYGLRLANDSQGRGSASPYLELPIYSHLAAIEANRPYFTFTLSDSIPIVTPTSPLRRFVDPTQAVVFAWDYENAVGGAQKSFTIHVSPDGETWTTLASGTTALTTATVAANTIASNIKYWRMQVVSEYDIASEWSPAVQIVLIANPACSINSTVVAPRPTVYWSCAGQQAYQVVCGAYDSGVVFGTEKMHKLPIFLPNGTYSLMVRSQDNRGLWSNWSQSEITISNVSGDAITLTAFTTHRVKLTWSGGAAGPYYVLRDGEPIAKTSATTYYDELASGKHSYTVLEQLDGSNYTLSNEETVNVLPKNAIITPVDAISWQNINYSREQYTSIEESRQRTAVLVHYEGRSLPVAEISAFEDKTLTFVVAFKTQDAAIAFEALFGRIVCYKHKLGRSIIGLLTGASSETDRFYSQYTCTITATDYQEAVDYE